MSQDRFQLAHLLGFEEGKVAGLKMMMEHGLDSFNTVAYQIHPLLLLTFTKYHRNLTLARLHLVIALLGDHSRPKRAALSKVTLSVL